MKGLILSGGKGTRLKPLTYTLAKQLVPVANTPVLVRVIELLREAGINEIGIIIAPNTGDEIRAAVGDGSRWGVHIEYILQSSPDGLAHAVKIAEPFVGAERFAMILGDNVFQGGIKPLINDFASHDWNCQIVLKEVDDPRSYGVAKLREDGSIEQLIEKPQNPPSNLALTGIYMFDHHVFEAVNKIQPSQRGEYEITDAIQWLINHGYVVRPHIHQGWWIDTGKPIDMLEANASVLDELTPSIAPDVVIENSEVDRRVTLQAGAQIINSTIRGPSIIGEGTVIRDSYIGPHTSIYHHVIIDQCEIDRCIVLENSEIRGLQTRLQNSLIGRHTKVTRREERPLALTMNLGDHSSVEII